VRKIESIARDHDASGIASVRIRLGALSHISAGHFAEQFALATLGTVAESARLEIETSSDESDPLAQDIILVSVEVEEQ